MAESEQPRLIVCASVVSILGFSVIIDFIIVNKKRFTS